MAQRQRGIPMGEAMGRARRAVAAAAIAELTEVEFMAQVTQLAELCGWWWMHVRPLMKQSGSWRTPMSGPLAKGWPDLLLVRPRTGQLLLVELKSDAGRLTDDQVAVLDVLRSSATVDVWRPADMTRITEALR